MATLKPRFFSPGPLQNRGLISRTSHTIGVFHPWSGTKTWFFFPIHPRNWTIFNNKPKVYSNFNWLDNNLSRIMIKDSCCFKTRQNLCGRFNDIPVSELICWKGGGGGSIFPARQPKNVGGLFRGFTWVPPPPPGISISVRNNEQYGIS